MLKDYLEKPPAESGNSRRLSSHHSSCWLVPAIHLVSFAETGWSYLDPKLVSCLLIVFAFCTTSLGVFSMPPRNISFFLPSNYLEVKFSNFLFYYEIFSCCPIVLGGFFMAFLCSCGIFQHPLKKQLSGQSMVLHYTLLLQNQISHPFTYSLSFPV